VARVLRKALAAVARKALKRCAHDWREDKGRYLQNGKVFIYWRQCTKCKAVEDQTDPAVFQIPEFWKVVDRKGSTVGKLKK
jgi:hypothetical protein